MKVIRILLFISIFLICFLNLGSVFGEGDSDVDRYLFEGDSDVDRYLFDESYTPQSSAGLVLTSQNLSGSEIYYLGDGESVTISLFSSNYILTSVSSDGEFAQMSLIGQGFSDSFRITFGEERNFDINKDGNNDLNILLINPGFAESAFTLTYLSYDGQNLQDAQPPADTSNQQSNQNTQPPADTSNQQSNQNPQTSGDNTNLPINSNNAGNDDTSDDSGIDWNKMKEMINLDKIFNYLSEKNKIGLFAAVLIIIVVLAGVALLLDSGKSKSLREKENERFFKPEPRSNLARNPLSRV